MKNEENNPLNNNNDNPPNIDNQGEQHHSQENLNPDNVDRIGVEAKKPNVTSTSGVRDTKQKEEDQKISKN